jgi:hypothetical protein
VQQPHALLQTEGSDGARLTRVGVDVDVEEDTDQHKMLLEGRETFVRVLVTLTLVLIRRDCPLPVYGGEMEGGGWGQESKGGKGGVEREIVDEALVRIVEEMLQMLRREPLDTSVYLPHTLTHRIKNRLWQAIAIITPLLPRRRQQQQQHGAEDGGSTGKGGQEEREERIEAVVGSIFAALRKDERKSVRHYLEIAAFEMLRGDAGRMLSHLSALLRDFDLEIPVAASALLITNFLFRFHLPAGEACRGKGGGHGDGGGEVVAALEELAKELLPWFSHHTHHVRALASLALKHYCAHSGRGGDRSRQGGGGELLTEAALAFMTTNDDVARLHAHLEDLFFSSLDLTSICSHAKVLLPSSPPSLLPSSRLTPSIFMKTLATRVRAQRGSLRPYVVSEAKSWCTPSVLPETRPYAYIGNM